MCGRFWAFTGCSPLHAAKAFANHRTTQASGLDLSLTFHIVSYLDGAVPDWPKLLDTTLAIKDRRYPNGWQSTIGYDKRVR